MAKGPGPLERAAGGDDEALEHVLGGVVGPVFDTALHWHGDTAAADDAAVSALAALAEAIRAVPVPHDPLAFAVATVLASPAAGGDVARPPRLAGIDEDDRAIVIASLAGGLGAAEAAEALGRAGAAAPLEDVLEALGGAGSLQQELDEIGAAVRLSEGLVERAMERAGLGDGPA